MIVTIFTDSVDLYRSRLEELSREHGPYREIDAARDHAAVIGHQGADWFKELGYYDRKAIHNLKYFTWVEQQGKAVEELNAQWDPDFWQKMFEGEIGDFEKLIADFNREVGL
jgi:cysteine synthase